MSEVHVKLTFNLSVAAQKASAIFDDRDRFDLIPFMLSMFVKSSAGRLLMGAKSSDHTCSEISGSGFQLVFG